MDNRINVDSKLLDFAGLLIEWLRRYEFLGVPKHKLIAQARIVLDNFEKEEPEPKSVPAPPERRHSTMFGKFKNQSRETDE